MNNPNETGISPAQIMMLLAIAINIVAVSVAWGNISTLVKRFDRLIDHLFNQVELHGNRLTAIETRCGIKHHSCGHNVEDEGK